MQRGSPRRRREEWSVRGLGVGPILGERARIMQLYERGIRRRLAPMLHGDRPRLELAYSLLLTLPGTPVLRYGDEIGMRTRRVSCAVFFATGATMFALPRPFLPRTKPCLCARAMSCCRTSACRTETAGN